MIRTMHKSAKHNHSRHLALCLLRIGGTNVGETTTAQWRRVCKIAKHVQRRINVSHTRKVFVHTIQKAVGSAAGKQSQRWSDPDRYACNPYAAVHESTKRHNERNPHINNKMLHADKRQATRCRGD